MRKIIGVIVILFIISLIFGGALYYNSLRTKGDALFFGKVFEKFSSVENYCSSLCNSQDQATFCKKEFKYIIENEGGSAIITTCYGMGMNGYGIFCGGGMSFCK